MSRHLIIGCGIGFGLGCALWSVVSGVNIAGGALAVIGLAAAFLANIGAIGRRP